jgi:hypothetical protein
VAEVVRAELGLESIGCMAERSGHHAGVGNDDVERSALRQQAIRRLANAFETGEIQGHNFQATAVRLGGFPYFHCGVFGLRQVPRGAEDMRSVRCEGTRGLDAETGGNSGDQDAFAL